jgi:hypothetical protein
LKRVVHDQPRRCSLEQCRGNHGEKDDHTEKTHESYVTSDLVLIALIFLENAR